ncbi:MAG: glycosyltransferase family 2 protein [Lachnospiraceae bacterium]|nr:glycosyltransferase family 2 protein [Lachnospiraceae bacterium]
MAKIHTLTVFTPTYNRRELIKRTYESLKAQTLKDFVWLIADDGSEDGTGDVIKGFIDEGIIDIEYHYFENGGKMRAHNRGVELCDTELFVCLDSDDVFVEGAVEDLIGCYREIVSEDPFKKGILAGIVAHKGESGTKVLYGDEFPDVSYSTLFGLYLKGFKGETTLVFRTEVLKKYPFPEIEGEKYVPEDYIYDKIDKDYVLKVLPKIITVCEIVADGYTDSLKKIKKDNPVAWYLYYEQRTMITEAGILKFKYAGFYVIYAIRTRNKLYKKGSVPLFWVISGIPAAFLIKLMKKD